MVEETKKEFLQREEVKTMKKDLSRLRESEAQKEKERIVSLSPEKEAETRETARRQEEEKQRVEAERKGKEAAKKKEEEENEKRLAEIRAKNGRLKKELALAENELKKILDEKKRLEPEKNGLSAKMDLAEKKLSEILAREGECERKEKEIEEKEAIAVSGEEKTRIEKERWQAQEERKTAEKGRWVAEKEKNEVNVRFQAVETNYNGLSKKQEELERKIKELKSAGSPLEEKLKEGKTEIKKEAQTAQERFRKQTPAPAPKTGRPSLLEKALIRLIFIVFILFVLSFLYWFFVARKQADERKIEPPSDEEKTEETEIPAIPASPSLVPVNKTKMLYVAEIGEIADSLNAFLSGEFLQESLTRIIVIDSAKEEEVSAENLAKALQAEFPSKAYQNIEPDFTLAAFSQPQGQRLVFVAKTKNRAELAKALQDWEKKIEKEGVSIFGKKIPVLIPNFRQNSFGDVNFRYLTISKNDLVLGYALSGDYLIFATSLSSAQNVAQKLKN